MQAVCIIEKPWKVSKYCSFPFFCCSSLFRGVDSDRVVEQVSMERDVWEYGVFAQLPYPLPAWIETGCSRSLSCRTKCGERRSLDAHSLWKVTSQRLLCGLTKLFVGDICVLDTPCTFQPPLSQNVMHYLLPCIMAGIVFHTCSLGRRARPKFSSISSTILSALRLRPSGV